jgi:hypothetical protein
MIMIYIHMFRAGAIKELKKREVDLEKPNLQASCLDAAQKRAGSKGKEGVQRQ